MENKEKIQYSKEYWDVKNSGKRLLYKLSPMKNGKYRTFEVDEKDFNALKSLLGYVNRVESKTIYNNQLFAKLYIMDLVGRIRKSGTTIFNSFLFKDISNQLARPLDDFYKAFYEDICSNQLNKLTKGTFTDKEGNAVIMDYKRFKETFSLEYMKTKIDEQMNKTLHRRS
tara:strand:+ start:3089 stop:3598 length:510 start_codon:yes stop_codon:yes gene_type:complete